MHLVKPRFTLWLSIDAAKSISLKTQTEGDDEKEYIPAPQLP
jgi:hypothetical protein